ncbi:MAG: UDP-N-acetylglucosamine 2-epimerase (non-hydrolyzing) [Bacteroidales bacterium]|nr:UDP-N-acetylglucosamine 2-epimerase (non-hydrolyzing) [Bacteroidales bacterium]
MIKLLTVIGARPQIIKAAAISRSVKNYFSDSIDEKILHTGQHYDENMSQVFFDELGIPKPDYYLNVGSGMHGVQTAKMIEGIENVLQEEHFDGVILYGDTNSTLAGAVAVSKLHIPIFHIEAGLRSFNMSMPEEINRIVCDQLSSILFAPTETAMNNLKKEGFFESSAKFTSGKRRMIYNCGDVMYDNSLFYATIAQKKNHIITEYGLTENEYVLATIHRDNNTDDVDRLSSIFSSLIKIADEDGMKVVIPLHPRTSKLLETNLRKDVRSRLTLSKNMVLMPPSSFLGMINLERNAKIVMTDSGGVQKEAFFFEKPCVILRSETEWVEIVEHGAGMVVDADEEKIMEGYLRLIRSNIQFPSLFGNGNASQCILKKILSYYQ